MQRAATDVMQGIIFSAVLDAVEALKAASKGLPNQMIRDLQSIHPNTTFADLPKQLQDAIAASTRTAFTQLLKEGYAVGPRQSQASRPLDRVPDRQRADGRPGSSDRRPRRAEGGPRNRSGKEGKDPNGAGPGRGPGQGPRRPRPAKGKPRLS